jgi:hypothetical protein
MAMGAAFDPLFLPIGFAELIDLAANDILNSALSRLRQHFLDLLMGSRL